MNRIGFPPVPFFAALTMLAIYVSVSLLVRMMEYGPTLWWDSVHYISVARNLLKGEGFIAANGGNMAAWAPLYPVLLAAIGALASVDPRDVAGPLNAVLSGLCVLSAGAWIRQTLDSRFLVVWGCLVVALSPALTLISAAALSETMFILLMVLALTHMDRHLSGGGRPSLLWAAVFTGLAWATRYTGVMIVFTLIAALALRRGVSPTDKVKGIAVYALVSAAPVGAWMLRNFLATGRLTAPPIPVDYRWLEAVEDIPGALGSLLTDSMTTLVIWRENWPAVDTMLGGLAIACLAAAFIVSVMEKRGAREGVPLDAAGPFRLFGGFILLYVSVYAWTTIEGHTWHGVQRRHLVPLYIPFLFVFLLAADRFLRSLTQSAGATARWMSAATAGRLTLTVALSFWVAWNAPEHLTGALRGDGTHWGYSFHYRDSEIMRYLRDNPSKAVLYSNEPYRTYIHLYKGSSDAGIYSVPGMRRIGQIVGEVEQRNSLDVLLERAEEGDRVVWFFGHPASFYNFDYADMRGRPGLRLVAEHAEGAVFEVDKTYSGGGHEFWTAVLAAEPIASAFFDVYLRENRLIYVRKPCLRTDSLATFFLHVVPVDDNNLEDDRKQYGFANFDFDFRRHGTRFDGTCIAIIALPEWQVARVVTGQFAGDNRFWEADGAVLEVDKTSGGKADEWLSATLAAEPSARAVFDVRVRENRLIYSKTPCVDADTRARFFLHVFPSDERYLPDDRKRHGFVNLDFDFKRVRTEFDETCATVVTLPDWRITRMMTGQFTGRNRLWEVEIPIGDGETGRAPASRPAIKGQR